MHLLLASLMSIQFTSCVNMTFYSLTINTKNRLKLISLFFQIKNFFYSFLILLSPLLLQELNSILQSLLVKIRDIDLIDSDRLYMLFLISS